VTVDDVYVAGEALDIPVDVWDVDRNGGANAILDSRTSLTILSTPAHRAVVAALSRHLASGAPEIPKLLVRFTESTRLARFKHTRCTPWHPSHGPLELQSFGSADKDEDNDGPASGSGSHEKKPRPFPVAPDMALSSSASSPFLYEAATATAIACPFPVAPAQARGVGASACHGRVGAQGRGALARHGSVGAPPHHGRCGRTS
jgi:hypothetical protein